MSYSRLGGVAVAALLAGALPALAQAPSCGGVGATGAWIGGGEGNSDVSTAAIAFDTRDTAARNGEIVTLFSVSSPTEVRVEALPDMGGDTVIDLLDASGGIVTSDDDGGGGLASRAEVMLEPGEYCLLTRGLGGEPVTADIRVGRSDQESLTAGSFFQEDLESCTADTPATQLGTAALGASGVTLSATNSVEAESFYRFSTDGTVPVTVTAQNEAADPVIYLYDSAGELLAENDDFDGLNSRIDLDTPLAAGEYCVAVRALSSETDPITITVSEFSEQDYLAGLYDRGEAAPPLDGSYPVTDLGFLENRMRQDVRVTAGTASWFTVEMPEGGVLLVEAISLAESDPTLTMFDDLGRQIGFNDDNGENLNSLLAVRVQPGLHMFAVNLLGEGGGSIRLALERFERVR